MNRVPALLLFLGIASAAPAGPDPLDRLEEALSIASPSGEFRARASGTLDLEEYSFDRPAPGLISSDASHLFTPRLTLYVDAQLGRNFYFFGQGRIDRGFDPAAGRLRGRADEYAVRFSPLTGGALNFQVGKFATAVGSWVRRHDSWNNDFITAPLAYENVTGIFDIAAASSTPLLLKWAGLGPGPFPHEEYLAQLRVPVIWGPGYATGAAISGAVGAAEYNFEIKNAALSSRPAEWTPDATDWAHPTWSGRVGFHPNPAWSLGFSASTGSYLQHSALPTLAPGTTLGDYRENVFGQDIGYAWHHLQLWGELFETRYNIPRVGVAETWAYYLEARVKFSPQFSGAIRWNQQLFGDVPAGGAGSVRWGRDTWRIDVAPAYRFSAHVQVKLQYSLQAHPLGVSATTQLVATQLVVRF